MEETEKEKLEALIKKWRLLLRTILMYNVYICIGIHTSYAVKKIQACG